MSYMWLIVEPVERHKLSRVNEARAEFARAAEMMRNESECRPLREAGRRHVRVARRTGGQAAAGWRKRCTAWTTTEPSPTPAATRLTDPERTSPTA